MFLLRKASFVITNKINSIIYVVDVIAFIIFGAAPSLAKKIFNGLAFIFLNCAFIEPPLNLA